MAVDRVCVVQSSGSACVNQDILFLGTGMYVHVHVHVQQ